MALALVVCLISSNLFATKVFHLGWNINLPGAVIIFPISYILNDCFTEVYGYRKARLEPVKSGTFWLSESPDVPGVVGWGAMCPRVCSYAILREKESGKRLAFANTHTDHYSALAREKGMLLIIERMKEFGEGAPIVFTGDHNCRETEVPAQAVAKMLRNALYESETPPTGPWRTFNGWKWLDSEIATLDALRESPEERNAPERACRIDYIYVSPGVHVLDYATVADVRRVLHLYPSDHFPIVSTIEI